MTCAVIFPMKNLFVLSCMHTAPVLLELKKNCQKEFRKNSSATPAGDPATVRDNYFGPRLVALACSGSVFFIGRVPLERAVRLSGGHLGFSNRGDLERMNGAGIGERE